MTEGPCRIRLTPVSYAVLGLLATHGPSTPYDLKAAVARSVGYLWAFPHTQLYAEPARLAAAGLVAEEREEGGRRRRVLSVTAPGRRALDAWLHDAEASPRELRDVGLLKLYFTGLADADALVALGRQQELAHRDRLAAFEALEASTRDDESGRHARATLSMGLAFERLAVRFWAEVAAGRLPDPAPQEG